jgi:hypothetical protein
MSVVRIEGRDQGYIADVNSSRELKVSANVSNTVAVSGSVTVSSGSVSISSGTVDIGSGTVDVGSVADPVTTEVIESSAVNHNQVSVDNTTGGLQILASQSREAYTIKNLDATKTVFLGIGAGADASSGFPLKPGESYTSPPNTKSYHQVKGFVSSGSAIVAYVEHRQ